MMRTLRRVQMGLCGLVCLFAAGCVLLPPPVAQDSPPGLLLDSLNAMVRVVEPARDREARTFHARFKIVEAEGVSDKFRGQEVELALQAPDRLFLKATISGKQFHLGRNGQELWIYAADKKFCLIGQPGVALFTEPTDAGTSSQLRKVSTREAPTASSLKPLHSPISRTRLAYLPRYVNVMRQPDEQIGPHLCTVLSAVPTPEAIQKRRLPDVRLELWARQSDRLPQRIRYSNNHGVRLTFEAQEMDFGPAWPSARWAFTPAAGDRTETVALSHLTQFISSKLSTLTQTIPTLGPATGERRVIASEGAGRLESVDGTRVLVLKGSPEEMGRQHGVLLQRQIQRDVRNVLYGVGVGSSLANGTWFFGEMEAAQRRLLPHMDARYLREMDALADSAGISRAEVRMANLFPELFHCSGFAIFGDATRDGRLYHGRILDYFRGQGLEQNAVVIVSQPDYGHAWVNISYAGFTGSVTAMNEKHVAIGEMGGHGEGKWDGKPMAQLVREVMERANTIDEALEIMRRAPRTCEYYYVISDGKSKRAVAVRATPTEFETAWAGETHPLIPEAIKDAVMVSGGERFGELIRRVKAGYGTFDAESARGLMSRPVCMPSNIHSVLFAPETLDFWVANADSKNVASHTRYTRYNLRELLDGATRPIARASQ